MSFSLPKDPFDSLEIQLAFAKVRVITLLSSILTISNFSILELVDAAVPSQQLEPFKKTILGVEGVKVSQFQPVYIYFLSHFF